MNERLVKLSTVFGFAGCVISGFVFGSYYGYSFVSDVCDFRYPMIGELGWVSGLNPYLKAFDYQRLICLFFFVFLIGRYFRTTIASHVICSSALVLISINLYALFTMKALLWNETDKYLSLARELYAYDLALIFAVLVLVVLEIVMIASQIASKTQVRQTVDP